MSVYLEEMLSGWNQQERNKVNENWRRIMATFSKLQTQINILAGGEVDVLLEKLNKAIDDANIAVQEAIDANNTALQIALNKIGTALTDIGGAIQAAETATNDAMEAKGAALQAAADAQTTISQMQVIISNFRSRGEWNATTDYFKNNLAGLNGKTYIALQNNTNKPVTETSFWMLFADRGAKGEKGEKGDPGTGIKVLGHFNDVSELPSNPILGDAYTIGTDRELYVYNGNDWQNMGSIKGVEGKSAYEVAVENGFVGTEIEWLESLTGPPGPDGPPGPPADLTEINQKVDGIQNEVTQHLAQFEQLQGTVTNHETRLDTLEQGGTTNANIISGLNREVAYLKLKQAATDRISGGTVFADDLKGTLFGMSRTSQDIMFSGVGAVPAKIVNTEQTINSNIVAPSGVSPENTSARHCIMLNDGTLFQVVKSTSTRFCIYKRNATTGEVSLFKDIARSATYLTMETDGFNVYLVFIFGTTNIVIYGWDADGVGISDIGGTNGKTIVTLTSGTINSLDFIMSPSTRKFHIGYTVTDGAVGIVRIITSTDTYEADSWTSPVAVVSEISTTHLYVQLVCLKNDAFPKVISFRNGTPAHSIVLYGHNGTAWVKQTDVITTTVNTGLNGLSAMTTDEEKVVVAFSERASSSDPYFVHFMVSNNRGATFGGKMQVHEGIIPSTGTDNEKNILITSRTATALPKFAVFNPEGTLATNAGEYTDAVTGAVAYLPRKYRLPAVEPVCGVEYTNFARFLGKYLLGSIVQLLEGKLIYAIPATNFVGAYVKKKGDITITAEVNGFPMNSELNDNEYEFTVKLPNDAPATMTLTLSRETVAGGFNDGSSLLLGGRS